MRTTESTAFARRVTGDERIGGERVDTSSWISAVRTSRAGAQIVQFEQVDAEGAVVVEHGTTIITHGRLELRS